MVKLPVIWSRRRTKTKMMTVRREIIFAITTLNASKNSTQVKCQVFIIVLLNILHTCSLQICSNFKLNSKKNVLLVPKYNYMMSKILEIIIASIN